ncbi:ATP-binding cassette, subfamily B [Streptomyces sp. 1222.5]|uniref:hypothetical protein n=1 Tax=unclassified Streptomyces TaxID=2593676 RepID=UPI00089CD92D|nr:MULTISPECIES: hypothetical protein [unclassified Streptomyces]PKW08598.1 hypothetical protein BX260_3806 [Streptomyces sp. 5112.2]SEC58825.1 ATP-binding cassette, subfamily B [Streptomyces sp. 1222.5]
MVREARAAFRRFWPLTRGDRRWLAVITACVVAAVLAETVAILLFAELTDHALAAGSPSAFWGPAGAWLGVAVLAALASSPARAAPENPPWPGSSPASTTPAPG